MINTFEEIRELNLSQEVRNDKYVQEFANTMMNLSNRLNEITDNDPFDDALDIKDDYLPSIREFIVNTTGL